MLENYQKTEVAHINEVIACIDSDIEKIDEKYRKLAETEKEALVAARKAFSTALDFWNKLDTFPHMTETTTKEEKVEEKAKEVKVLNAEEQVVDNLFPENNEPEDEESALVEKDDEPEFDGAGFTTEDNIPPVEEEKELDLGAMKQDDTVLEFEEETAEEIEKEEDEKGGGPTDDEWNEISQW